MKFQKKRFHVVGLTLQVVAGNKLQHLINENDREGQLQHYEPLFHVQVGQLEDQLEIIKMRGISIRSSSRQWLSVLQDKCSVDKGKGSSVGDAALLEEQTYRQGVHIDDHEVQGHGEGHGGQQPAVAPWWHTDKWLVLRQAGAMWIKCIVKSNITIGSLSELFKTFYLKFINYSHGQ